MDISINLFIDGVHFSEAKWLISNKWVTIIFDCSTPSLFSVLFHKRWRARIIVTHSNDGLTLLNYHLIAHTKNCIQMYFFSFFSIKFICLDMSVQNGNSVYKQISYYFLNNFIAIQIPTNGIQMLMALVCWVLVLALTFDFLCSWLKFNTFQPFNCFFQVI